jgi:DNA/RNA-binding domain of Phe-tRNA-synthetase-like protein
MERSIEIALTPTFRTAFPGGIFGALIVRGCPNRARAERLDTDTSAVEARLRQRFPGETIDADPVAMAYAGYFRRYGSRYPVVHQAKTILTGRPIESPPALVEAMFAAEVDSLVLTSGHDLDMLEGPLSVDVTRDGDAYTKISGKPQVLKPGDMVVRDGAGIIASVLYGPDHRTRLRAESRAALFGAWCPVSLTVAPVEAHLAALARLLQREWPDALVDPPRIWTAANPPPAVSGTMLPQPCPQT